MMQEEGHLLGDRMEGGEAKVPPSEQTFNRLVLINKRVTGRKDPDWVMAM
jgi:hypothetical protein